MLAISPMDQSTQQISVTILRLGGAPVPPEIEERLRREMLDARLAIGSPLQCEPPDSRVALIYLPVGTALDSLRKVVGWASRARPPLGLLGCCPGGAAGDTEAALAAGFDDFVVTRISSRELAGRVRAVARRVRRPVGLDDDRTRFGEVRLDPSRHQALVGDRSVNLTRTEFLVMQVLVNARGRATSRVEMLDAAWGDESLELGERSVDNVVMRLRRKLGDRDLIVTVRGVGFRLAETSTENRRDGDG